MDKQIFDVEIWGNYTIQVEAASYDEAKRMGLALYRKQYGSVNSLDFWPVDKVVTKITPSKKECMQYV